MTRSRRPPSCHPGPATVASRPHAQERPCLAVSGRVGVIRERVTQSVTHSSPAPSAWKHAATTRSRVGAGRLERFVDALVEADYGCTVGDLPPGLMSGLLPAQGCVYPGGSARSHVTRMT